MTRLTRIGPAAGLLTAVLLLVSALACAAPPQAIYARALATAGRSAADRERDARDRPAELYAFAGIAPGMRIADIFGGGGYHSELLGYVVGPTGHVLLVNDPAYAVYAAKDLAARFDGGRLPAIERRVAPNADLGLGRATLDGALMVMSYHDLYYADGDDFPRIDAQGFLEQIRAAVRPGGFFLVVDHAAAGGTGSAAAQKLHRIDEQYAIHDIEAHGFRLQRRWDGLRSAADDHSLPVFDPAIRGHTDRFVHLYRRS